MQSEGENLGQRGPLIGASRFSPRPVRSMEWSQGSRSQGPALPLTSSHVGRWWHFPGLSFSICPRESC